MQSWPINCQKMPQTQFPKKRSQPQESSLLPFLSSECLMLHHFPVTCSACLRKVSEIAGTDNIYRQLCGYYICKSVSHSSQAKNLMQARKCRGVDYIQFSDNSVLVQTYLPYDKREKHWLFLLLGWLNIKSKILALAKLVGNLPLTSMEPGFDPGWIQFPYVLP